MTDQASPFRGAGQRRQQLPEEVAGYVRELIMTGQVKPGEFLRMEPIAEAVGVSNTPSGRGCSRSAAKGSSSWSPPGFIVAQISEQDVRDLFWTQAQLAAELAARAAKKLTPEHLDRIAAINEEFERAAEAGDHERVTALGHQFHREINRAADSRRLSLLLASVVKHLPNRFYASIEGHVDTTRNDHAELIEALRARNARKARSISERHILDGAEGVLRTLAERGLWAATESAS